MSEQCEWKEDPDEYMAGCWDTACGEKWCFTEGGPTDNGMKFCHNCGKPVELAKPEHGEG